MKLEEAKKALAQIDPSTVFIFVGAGFTRGLGYPTWSGLMKDHVVPFLKGENRLVGELAEARLSQTDLLGAADLLYMREVDSNRRAKLLIDIFNTVPALRKRDRQLGALPVRAFVTTNFDCTLERAINLHRLAQPYVGIDRFRRFNSVLGLSRDDSGAQPTSVPVLKIHSDATDLENVVLSGESFKRIRQTEGFSGFYQSALRGYHILFLGFGGVDDNIEVELAKAIKDFSGFGMLTSFLVIPEGSSSEISIEGSPIRQVQYVADEAHSPIDELVDHLSQVWSKPLLSGVKPAFSPPPPPLTSIFELLVPAIRERADIRVLDLVGQRMVRDALSAASPSTSKPAVVNQLVQRFRIGFSRAEELFDMYSAKPAPPSNANDDDSLAILASGLWSRCVAVDSTFTKRRDALKPLVRQTIEAVLQDYGAGVALSLVAGEVLEKANVAHSTHRILKASPPPGFGDADVGVVSLALADIFLSPNPSEAEVLTRLSVTATAFGLILALPRLDTPSEIVPNRVYFDTNVLLPLLVDVPQRTDAFRALARLAKKFDCELAALDVFLQEAESHFRGALALLRHHKLRTVKELRAWLGAGLDEFRNVFLVHLQHSSADDAENAVTALNRLIPDPVAKTLANRVAAMDIVIVPTMRPPPESAASLGQLIRVSKLNWYDRSIEAQSILARNEALQIELLQKDKAASVRSWFVTGDGQLRRIVRALDLRANERVIHVSAAMSLLQSLATGKDLVPAFSRLLWAAKPDDEIDQALYEQIRLLTKAVSFKSPIPIEAARTLAHEEFRRRSDELKDDDHSIDAAPVHLRARESALLAISNYVTVPAKK